MGFYFNFDQFLVYFSDFGGWAGFWRFLRCWPISERFVIDFASILTNFGTFCGILSELLTNFW